MVAEADPPPTSRVQSWKSTLEFSQWNLKLKNGIHSNSNESIPWDSEDYSFDRFSSKDHQSTILWWSVMKHFQLINAGDSHIFLQSWGLPVNGIWVNKDIFKSTCDFGSRFQHPEKVTRRVVTILQPQHVQSSFVSIPPSFSRDIPARSKRLPPGRKTLSLLFTDQVFVFEFQENRNKNVTNTVQNGKT